MHCMFYACAISPIMNDWSVINGAAMSHFINSGLVSDLLAIASYKPYMTNVDRQAFDCSIGIATNTDGPSLAYVSQYSVYITGSNQSEVTRAERGHLDEMQQIVLLQGSLTDDYCLLLSVLENTST